MKSKKGENKFENITRSIIFFMIAGFIGAGLVLGLEEFNKQDIITNPFSVNEENGTVSGGRISFDFGSFPYRLTGVSQVGNASLIANFGVTVNCTTGDGGFCFVNSTYKNGDTFNLTYSYAANTIAANITRNSTIGILNVTTLFTVVGILIGVGLLLIVVTRFGKGKE